MHYFIRCVSAPLTDDHGEGWGRGLWLQGQRGQWRGQQWHNAAGCAAAQENGAGVAGAGERPAAIADGAAVVSDNCSALRAVQVALYLLAVGIGGIRTRHHAAVLAGVHVPNHHF
jgi:hypothetical protein